MHSEKVLAIHSHYQEVLRKSREAQEQYYHKIKSLCADLGIELDISAPDWEWHKAVEDCCVVNWVTYHKDNPKKTLSGLLAYEAQLALDPQVSAEAKKLHDALEESLKLQSHYAELLNQYDGGTRRTFTKDEWLSKISEL